MLKLKLNPAFLFDSLKTLYSLTKHQPKQAPDVVLHLAHFLRYVLYESQADTVPLALEVRTIEQYVFLQQAIHPTDLEVSLTIRGAIDYQPIAPLLLFRIVENAFNQLPVEVTAQPPEEPSWVSIDLAIGETHLTLKVISGQTVSPTDNSKQLADIQKQLYFHYVDRYDLQILSEPDAFIVVLTLPLATTSESVPIPQLYAPDHETTLPDR